MRGDPGYEAQHARRMIFTEYGLHFTKEGDHWRCVENPDLLMMRGERYRVGWREFAMKAGTRRSGGPSWPTSASNSMSGTSRPGRT